MIWKTKNANLKYIIKEWETALILPPIFASPFTTIKPWKILDDTPESISKLKGTSSLLLVVIQYIGKHIKKRMSLILYTWELTNNFIALASKMEKLKQYLEVDLQNDEGFYKETITTLVIKVSNMTRNKRKE
jgi:hypothetical protein